MAIKGFKDIIDRKGYKVDSEDRKVFEKEISKSNFGLGCSDMIEFILFDSSENQLPQGDDGKLVRYIYLNDININDYFLISDNQFTKKKNGTTEFIVDIEKLIREAGYSNGIFKTQVTLLNRRVGVDGIEGDNLWVHEISPSRTEIRLLPNRAKKKNKDLEERLSIFLDKGTFRDDVIYYVNVFIENLDLEKILQDFLMSKGKETDGVEYINLIKTEFKVESFEILINRIKTKFIESMTHYSANRNWSINDINYGKPNGDITDCIALSIKQLQQDAQQSLINCIDYYLPKRDIQRDSILSKEEQITLDKVSQILKSTTSKSLYTSTVPDKVNARVRGCTDSNAENFNPLAQENDGSCTYKTIEEVIDNPIKGCMDTSAINFNPNATVGNGTCRYNDKIDSVSKKYYVWSATASIKYKQNGVINNVNGVEYDSFNITHDNKSFKFIGDVREVPKSVKTTSTVRYFIKNNNNRPSSYRPYPERDDRYGNDVSGYNGYGNERTNPYYNEENITPLTVTYRDAVGNMKTSSTLSPGDTTTVCAQRGSVTPMSGISVIDQGTCAEVPPKTTSNSNTTGTSSGGSGGGGYGGGSGWDVINENPRNGGDRTFSIGRPTNQK